MRDPKEPEKTKMPRMLALLIWHKGAWHELVLNEGVEVDQSDKQTLVELDNVQTEVLN